MRTTEDISANIPREDSDAPAIEDERTPKSERSTDLERRQLPLPIPWHVLFPPGHPMHDVGLH